MKVAYPVIFTKTNDEKDIYLIEIPDIQGLTEGYGMDDAVFMARDYIGCYFLDESMQIPEASRIEGVDISKGVFAGEGDSTVALVDLDIDAHRKSEDDKAMHREMLKVYPAVIHEECGYWVDFPDLEGCQACGVTLAEV